jgi:hypothetical protein
MVAKRGFLLEPKKAAEKVNWTDLQRVVPKVVNLAEL